MTMIAKTLRAIRRYWEDNDIEDHPLEEKDITYLISTMAIFILKNVKDDTTAIPKFCKQVLILKECLEVKSLHPLGENCKEATDFTLSSDCTTDWLDCGILACFRNQTFVIAFFASIEDLVINHSEVFPSMFPGMKPISVPTDNSITAAMASLPPGYEEVLLCLQYKISSKIVPTMFTTVFDSDIGFGGPGTLLRLIVDMIESQCFNRQILSHGFDDYFVFKPLSSSRQTTNTSDDDDKDDDEDERGTHQPMTLAEAIVDSIIGILGPFPNNVAYAPILQHLFYLEALRESQRNVPNDEKKYPLLRMFLEHCQHEEFGLYGVHAIHIMGLHHVLSTILSSHVPKHTERYKNLFCRSQIEDEVLLNVLPISIMKEIFAMILGVGRVVVSGNDDYRAQKKDKTKSKKAVKVKSKGKGKGKGKKKDVEEESESEENEDDDNDGFGKFALTTLSSCTECIAQHGSVLISESDLIKIRDVLLSNPAKYKDELEEKDYHKLLAVCQTIVGPGEAAAVVTCAPNASKEEEERAGDDSDDWEEIEDDEEEEEEEVRGKRKRVITTTASSSRGGRKTAARGNKAGTHQKKSNTDKTVSTVKRSNNKK